jgi:hypothetical protein
MVEISDGNCKFERPIIECPEVQPLPYRVPNPTKKPPKMIKIKPLSENKLLKENNADGIKLEKSDRPNAAKSALVASESWIVFGSAKKRMAK